MMEQQEYIIRMIDALGIDHLIKALTYAVILWGIGQIARVKLILNPAQDTSEKEEDP